MILIYPYVPLHWNMWSRLNSCQSWSCCTGLSEAIWFWVCLTMSNFITSQADHFVGPDLARWQRRLAALHPGRRFAETRLRWLRWSPIIWASLRFYVRKKIWKHTMNQPSMVKARLDNDYNILIYIIMILPRSSRETCRTDDMNWHHRTVSICLDHCALLCVLWAWPRFRLTRHALLGCWATPAGHQLTNKERGSQALAARCCKVSTISIYFVHFCSTDFYPFTIFHPADIQLH